MTLNNLKSIVGAQANQAARPLAGMVGSATHLVGAGDSSLAKFIDGIKKTELTDVSTGPVLAAAGAAAGGVIGMKKGHWLLGGLAGASAGRNIPALIRPSERKYAVANMGQTGLGVAGSLMFHKHPAIGFVIGWLAGGMIVSGLRK